MVDDECPIILDKNTRMASPCIVGETLTRFIHDDPLIFPVHSIFRTIDGQAFVRIGNDPEPALPAESESPLLIGMPRHIDPIDITLS